METSSHEFWTSALAATASLLAAGVALGLAARRRAAQRLGPVLSRERGARGPRIALFACLAAAAWAVQAQATALPAAVALAVLLLAVGALALSPWGDEAAIGERGVRRGWSARCYEDLEEWRLTGEHLRWRLRGEWQACRAPLELHAQLRERLRRTCAERESPFKD